MTLMLSNFLSASILIITLVALLITVARDRDSNSEDCSILVVLFFPSTVIFRHPWADFRETLPHDAVCSEIVDLL